MSIIRLAVLRIAIFTFVLIAIGWGAIWPSLFTIGAILVVPCAVTCWLFHPEQMQWGFIEYYTISAGIYAVAAVLSFAYF
jgi:hypothetical protein